MHFVVKRASRSRRCAAGSGRCRATHRRRHGSRRCEAIASDIDLAAIAAASHAAGVAKKRKRQRIDRLIDAHLWLRRRAKSQALKKWACRSARLAPSHQHQAKTGNAKAEQRERRGLGYFGSGQQNAELCRIHTHPLSVAVILSRCLPHDVILFLFSFQFDSGNSLRCPGSSSIRSAARMFGSWTISCRTVG